MSVTELNALISLLEDPDEGIYHTVRQELEQIGEAVLLPLRDAISEEGHGDIFLKRAKELLDHLGADEVRGGFADWINSDDHHLAEALILLDRYIDPTRSVEALKETLQRVRQDIWLELNDDMTALEQVRVINRIFFEHHGFAGTRGGAAKPSHALPREVIEQRKGNSLALGALYLAMAQELGLPIHGVNLPNHFILAYCDGGHLGEFSEDGGPGSILFYINPFSKGSIIHPEEVNVFLGHLDLPVDQQHCGPCHPVDVVRRLIGNLAYAFEREEQLEEAERMRELLFFVEGCSSPKRTERAE
ncbi:MAG: transglutaminase-like domain-containing protein [Flavobacteriales bacterium]|nr:transglutaminase-like domain-containing protein [Flavobacteriales bacterium]